MEGLPSVGCLDLTLLHEHRTEPDSTMSESEIPPRTDSGAHDSIADNSFEEDLETTIFVGDIRKDSTEKDLVDFFSQFGVVDAVSIKYSKITRQPLGYGFVKMSSVEEVEMILSEHPTVFIKGKRVRLGSAKRNCKLRIHNLAPTVTTHDLNAAFNKFGELFDQDTTIIYGGNGVPNSAVLHFKSRRQAQIAKLEMNNTSLCDRPMRIEWYHQYNSKNDKKDSARGVADSNFIDEPAVSLHVKFKTFEDNIVVTEEVIRQAFLKFGHVTLVSIKTNIHDTVQNRYRGYAFVHYDNNYIGRNSAIQAVNAMQLAYCNGIQYVTQVSNNFMRHEEHIPVYYYPALPMPTTPTAYFTSFDEFDNDPPQPLPPSAYNMYYPTPYENTDNRPVYYSNSPMVEMRYSPAPLWPQYIIPANSSSFYQSPPDEFPHVPSPRHLRNNNLF